MARNVEILLSIHKPNHLWLNELLTSIQKQTIQPTSVIVRLDGDFTISETIEGLDFTIEVLEDKGHLGFTQSYFSLLSECTADFVLFCDQDDIWLENKISNLLKIQAKQSEPTLAFCNFEVINEDGVKLNYTAHRPKKITKFSFLFSNSIPGNTMMLNQPLVNLVKQSISLAGLPFWHDWWCLSIARELGKILGSNSKDMKYRIHDNNVIGLQVRKSKKLFAMLSRKQSTQWITQVEMLIRFMREIKVINGNIEFLEGLVLTFSKSRGKRLHFLLQNGLLKSDPVDFLQAMRFYVLV